MKTKYLFATLLISIFGKIELVNAQKRSFVQEDVVKVAGIFTDFQVSELPNTQRNTTRTYSDGLGRVVQSVALSASPSQKDIIQPIVYDNLGRQAVSYLPYASAASNGSFRNNAVNEQLAFYQTAGQKTAIDSNPYSQKVFDNSPLQRVLQSGEAGNGFQPGQHFKSFSTRSNLATETIRRWNPDGSYAGVFAAGSLTVNTGTDQEGNQTMVYTDQNGQVVLKKQLLDQAGTTSAETYYTYADGGQILYVIPPKAISTMNVSGNYSLLQASLNGLLFTYVYDELGRQVERTVPGGGTTYMVYDPMDRLVLAQNGKLRTENKWNYIKYDSRNVAISQGIFTGSGATSRLAAQALVNSINYATNYFEERNGDASNGYYTNRSFPVSGIEPLAYSYFDNYDLDGNGSADYSYQAQGLAGEKTQVLFTYGMPTITRTRTVGSGLSNIWLTAVTFYDKQGNTIQVQSNNHLNAAVGSLGTIVPDFVGKVLRKKTTVLAIGAVNVKTEYTYDHSDRLKTVDESYNGNTAVRIAAYEYNEIGQLVDRKLHCTNSGASYLQSVDYRYNIRGQLTSINNSSLSPDDKNDDNNDVFGIEMLYNQSDGGIGNTPYFNGSLSGVKWKVSAPGVATANERSYHFSYDRLMRLNAAIYAERSNGGTWNNNGAFDEKNISYDLNGNILSLQRNAILNGAITTVDNLSYSYDGNRLNNVIDGASSSTLFGFKNLTGSTAAYAYDSGGNMTIDPKKGISLDYNILNRTAKVTINTAAGRYINYTYEAGGTLIRKQAFDNNSLVKTTDYIGGFVYEDNVLAHFAMPEGRVRNANGVLKLEYMIKDQQGNVRVSFEDQGGVAVVRQENSYYPFGLSMPGNTIPGAANKNLYNGGSEWQNDFADLPDLQQTFYRMYDPALGRFVASDPKAESSESMSVYQYALNSPLMFNDPMGDISETAMRQVLDYARNGVTGFEGAGLYFQGDDVTPIGFSNNYGGGYWTQEAMPGTGVTEYFNALTGKMEQSVNVGGVKSTWNEARNTFAETHNLPVSPTMQDWKNYYSLLLSGDFKGAWNYDMPGEPKFVGLPSGAAAATTINGLRVAISGSKSVSPALYTVYKAVTKNGGVYWGMTKNFAQRAEQHGSRFASIVEVHVGIAGREAARGVEQIMIDGAGGINALENTINSIALQNPNILKYYQEGVRFLTTSGL
nr:DUF6443 domain-containing protein [uncultured Pedobacter sp.]